MYLWHVLADFLFLAMFQHFCVHVKHDFFDKIAAMVADTFQFANEQERFQPAVNMGYVLLQIRGKYRKRFSVDFVNLLILC